MNDTSLEMHQYQYNMIMQKSPQQRLEMGLEMIETGREFLIMGLKLQYPEMKESEIAYELLMRAKKYDNSLFWLDYVLPEKKLVLDF